MHAAYFLRVLTAIVLTPKTLMMKRRGRQVKSTEEIFSDLALLSRDASGWCVHNPNVAAALYDADGEFVASGVHKKKISSDHAEVVALKKAGTRAEGGTLFVSLEPCAHQGTTGPCTEAIRASGVKKVVYAVTDPNPLARGGAEKLQTFGVDVLHHKSEKLEFEQRAWLHRIEKGRPLVTAKVAITLDGRIAAADGTSKWITSEESRNDVQKLRSQVGAVITSTATYQADKPSLLPRLEGAPTPIRVVMGRTPVSADGFIAVGSRDHSQLIEFLNNEGVNHALVEAGGTFLAALLRARLIDELVIYQAPLLLGSGKLWLEELGINTLENAISLERISIEAIGQDVKSHYKVVHI